MTIVEGLTGVAKYLHEQGYDCQAAFIETGVRHITAIEARAEAAERDREAVRDYAFEITKALTGLVGGGSEMFLGRLFKGTDRELFKADLPFCIGRLRDRFTRSEERGDAWYRKMREAERERDAARAKVAELERRWKFWMRRFDGLLAECRLSPPADTRALAVEIDEEMKLQAAQAIFGFCHEDADWDNWPKTPRAASLSYEDYSQEDFIDMAGAALTAAAPLILRKAVGYAQSAHPSDHIALAVEIDDQLDAYVRILRGDARKLLLPSAREALAACIEKTLDALRGLRKALPPALKVVTPATLQEVADLVREDPALAGMLPPASEAHNDAFAKAIADLLRVSASNCESADDTATVLAIADRFEECALPPASETERKLADIDKDIQRSREYVAKIARANTIINALERKIGETERKLVEAEKRAEAAKWELQNALRSIDMLEELANAAELRRDEALAKVDAWAGRATIAERKLARATEALEYFAAWPISTIWESEDGSGFLVKVLKRPDGKQPTFTAFNTVRALLADIGTAPAEAEGTK
jgi:hypothetical protein